MFSAMSHRLMSCSRKHDYYFLTCITFIYDCSITCLDFFTCWLTAFGIQNRENWVNLSGKVLVEFAMFWGSYYARISWKSKWHRLFLFKENWWMGFIQLWSILGTVEIDIEIQKPTKVHFCLLICTKISKASSFYKYFIRFSDLCFFTF